MQYYMIWKSNWFSCLFYNWGCVGVINGTHISVSVPPGLADKFRGHKRDTTWNIIVACDFDLKFTYMLFGWEVSIYDTCVMDHAISEPQNNFSFPPVGNFIALNHYIAFINLTLF